VGVQSAPLWVTFDNPEKQAIPISGCPALADVQAVAAEVVKQLEVKYDWALDRVSRNKQQHALNGNGRSKGPSVSAAPDGTTTPSSTRQRTFKPKRTPHEKDLLQADAVVEADGGFSIEDRYIRAVQLHLKPSTWACVMLWSGKSDKWELPLKLEAIEGAERDRPSNRVQRLKKEGPAQAAAQSARERKEHCENVVLRLLKKINSYDDALEWVLTQPSKVSDDLALLLLSSLEKKDLPKDDTHFCLQHVVHRRPRYEALCGLSQFSSHVNTVVERSEFRQWMKELYPIYIDEIDDDVDWRAAKAGSHNKEMHSTNGNTSGMQFPDDMDDIRAHEHTVKICQERVSVVGATLANPLAEVEQQSGIKNIQGVTMSNVPSQMPIRGGVCNQANQYFVESDLNHPECLLYPREVRNGPGAGLINSGFELPLYGVGTVRRANKAGLVLSSYGTAVSEIILRQGNVRPDQLVAFGFYTSEMASLILSEGDRDGDSLVSVFLKLMLYCMSLSWQFPANNLPISCECSKFDSFTETSPNPNVQLDYNNGLNLFEENCGGAALPFMPFATNPNPRIGFHFTRATVPAGRTPLYLRPSLLLQNDRGDNALNFALVAMALADYPCGIHNVTITTTDTTGGNVAEQQYVPFSSCVHVDGYETLDLVIPVRQPIAPNQVNNQATANGLVVVQPTAGPSNWGVFAAGDLLDVNFPGNPAGYVDYPLCDFLGSWLADPAAVSPIDSMTVSRFMKQLAELTHRAKDLAIARELAFTMAVRYCPMFECVPNVLNPVPVNDPTSVAMQNFFALQPHFVVGDLPADQTAFDHYVPELNPQFWAKCMSGMYQGAEDGGTYPVTNYVTDGSPRLLQYAIHIVRDYAITGEYIFQYHRQSAALWNAAFTQSPMVNLVNTIRKYFVASDLSAGEGLVLKSVAGAFCAGLHFKVNGCAPAQDMWGLTIWSYLNAPRVGFMGVISTAFAELGTPIPCILPDIWSQLFTRRRSLAFSPLLSPLKKLTGIQATGAQVTAIGAGGYTIPANVQSQAREVGLNTVPLADDVEVFNARIVWHAFTASLYTLDNNQWNVSTLQPGNFVRQKYVNADYTVPNYIGGVIAAAKTNWMPYNTSTGLRLLPGVTALNGAALMSQVMVGRAYTGLMTWVFNNVSIQPNVIVGADGNENDGIWDVATSEGKGESASSTASSTDSAATQ